jgi:hypothetical protein
MMVGTVHVDEAYLRDVPLWLQQTKEKRQLLFLFLSYLKVKVELLHKQSQRNIY